jgi:hypothetical protein
MLYQRLCEIVWGAENLGFETVASAPPKLARRTSPLGRLLETGALAADEILIGVKRNARTKTEVEYGAQILADARILVDSGKIYPDLDSAGAAVLGLRSCKGWEFWHAMRGNDRISLRGIRKQTSGR